MFFLARPSLFPIRDNVFWGIGQVRGIGLIENRTCRIMADVDLMTIIIEGEIEKR
jgi:hypothetical protein